jgi:methanogenic corrinoid protein MtbC1
MESLKTYDNSLMNNEHYRKHEEMLPYIGKKYDENKILIISESSFVPKEIRNQLEDDWYEITNKEYIEKTIGNNSNFRKVIAQMSKGKGHRIFHNIANALKDANQNFTLENIAWYNFFQKPASYGKSIKPTKLDKEIAIKVFITVIETLKPNLVIFVSSLSFKELKDKRAWCSELNGHKYDKYEIPIGIVPHPNSKWWNTKCKNHGDRTGKEKFIEIINSHFKN